MRRRDYLITASGAALGTTLSGCLGIGGGAATGTLATHVSDQPGDIGDFESCVVTITEIRIKPAGDEEDDGDVEDDDDDGTPTGTGETATDEGTPTETEAEDEEDEDEAGVQTFEVDAEADLVQLQGENTKLIDEQEVETGEYQWMKLQVSNVDATLSAGGDATVDTPGQAPLKFNKAFEIRADTTTSFTADFTPVKRGQTGSYLLKPVADEVEVSYE